MKVQAYIPCSGLYEYRYNNEGSGNGCSLPGEVEDEDAETEVAACCPLVSSSTLPTYPYMSTSIPISTHRYTSTSIFIPTPSLTLSATPFSRKVTFIISATIVAVLVLVSTATTCLIIRQYCRRPPMPKSTVFLGNLSMNIPVLVVYSPRTPEVERKAIQQTLVFDLRDQYGIASHAPELRNEKHSLYDWMTEHHERAHAVFCVCNRYVYEEWNQTANLENNPSVVYLFKSLFEGNIKSDKYAVVLTDAADSMYVPPLLRHRQKYAIDDPVGITWFARDLCHFTA